VPGGGNRPDSKPSGSNAQGGIVGYSFLPPGDYTTSKLTLKSGTEIQGVPGKSVLHYNGGSTLISIENGTNIRLTGLTLWSEAKPLDGGVPLIVESVKGLNPV
jgi:hypothetical protein